MITGTDWLHAATQILIAAAWPLGILGIVLIFRRPVRDALSHLVKFRFGGAEVEIDRARAQAEVSTSVAEAIVDESQGAERTPTRTPLAEYYADRVVDNPLNAVLEAYIAIERRLDQVLEDHGQSPYVGTKKLDVTELSALAIQTGLLGSVVRTPLTGLTALRNIYLHGASELSLSDAQQFLSLADGVMFLIDNDVKRYDAEHTKAE